MRDDTVTVRRRKIPRTWVHTLVIGSGAAGLAAATQLHARGVTDLLVVTEGLKMGTSINTGSDKQTYYKLSLCGDEGDSPRDMARTYHAPGSMHGDLALVEASLSARAFLNLVNLGVPFPQDPYGQFVGYKTDHDPRTRATSVGPYTSREMCRALIREVRRRAIPVWERLNAVELITTGSGRARRAAGAVLLDGDGQFRLVQAENVVFAVGGPGGLYKASVYPGVHTGAIGLALLAGARAQGLPESQYGMASTKFRWNVSGSYMQVVPRFVSTDMKGGDERDFLSPWFDGPGDMASKVFLKGYQWPFDAAKAAGGSSLIDILVYIETVEKGRRVFLDYRRNAPGWALAKLSDEARTYLENCGATGKLPIDRLAAMNPGAIQLYRDHGIDIATEPLEIAVCAQHNNGGLAADHWWESATVRHLFPVGEVNGSHGVARPGGSALNAGQVGAIRVAERIAHRAGRTDGAWTLDRPAATAAAKDALARVMAYADACPTAATSWRQERDAFQARMSRAGAHVRSAGGLETAVREARAQWQRLARDGCGFGGFTPARGLREALRMRQLCFAHLVYLEALRFAVAGGLGSRGSALVLDPAGAVIHPDLGSTWRIAPEDPAYRERVLETDVSAAGRPRHRWVPRRPLPDSDLWFETAWKAFREGRIFE